MTTDRMAPIELLEKSADADFLREMLGFVADRLMALEAKGLCGATSDLRRETNLELAAEWIFAYLQSNRTSADAEGPN